LDTWAARAAPPSPVEAELPSPVTRTMWQGAKVGVAVGVAEGVAVLEWVNEGVAVGVAVDVGLCVGVEVEVKLGVPAAQAALLHRAKMNGLAALGQYDSSMEK
jgi:hypothetical protein